MITEVNKELYFDGRGYVGKLHSNDGTFVEHRISRSAFQVIRGFHGDNKTTKLLFCLHGVLDLICFDTDTGEKQKFILSEYDKQGILIPPGVLNAHQAASKDGCLLYYAWDQPYTPADKQWSVYYNDETINPEWSYIDENLISLRDRNAPRLLDFFKVVRT